MWGEGEVRDMEWLIGFINWICRRSQVVYRLTIVWLNVLGMCSLLGGGMSDGKNCTPRICHEN